MGEGGQGGEGSWRPAPLMLGSAGLHAAGVLAFALMPRHWPWIAATLFADHVALAAAGMAPRSQLLGPSLTRLGEDAARRNEVALTFDDGPDPQVTPRVLDLLDAAGARATFFCIGRRVEACSEVAAEIVRRGHEVENHTWSHPHSFVWYPPAALRREIGRTQEAIERATGRRPAWFRAPAGLRSPLLDRELWSAGLGLAAWTRRGYDAVEKDPRRIAGRLLRGLSAGDVLLLHDGSTVRESGGNPRVLEVLPRVLDGIAAQGLQPVPLGAAARSAQ